VAPAHSFLQEFGAAGTEIIVFLPKMLGSRFDLLGGSNKNGKQEGQARVTERGICGYHHGRCCGKISRAGIFSQNFQSTFSLTEPDKQSTIMQANQLETQTRP